jgi:hypothetical protein
MLLGEYKFHSEEKNGKLHAHCKLPMQITVHSPFSSVHVVYLHLFFYSTYKWDVTNKQKTDTTMKNRSINPNGINMYDLWVIK